MDNGRRLAARMAAQYIKDIMADPYAAITADGYELLLALAEFLRGKEHASLRAMGRIKDRNDKTEENLAIALEAFEHLRDAHNELKTGLATGEWDPESVVANLTAAANATGAKPAETQKKKSKKDLRSSLK